MNNTKNISKSKKYTNGDEYEPEKCKMCANGNFCYNNGNNSMKYIYVDTDDRDVGYVVNSCLGFICYDCIDIDDRDIDECQVILSPKIQKLLDENDMDFTENFMNSVMNSVSDVYDDSDSDSD